MLHRLLDLRPVGPDHWQGGRRPGARGRVFGGQVIAQALVAAQRSVPTDRLVHSLHAYFLRGGDDLFPIDFRVEADFDGGSFSNRRVVASQQGGAILNFTASFHRHEDGLTHQASMPDVPMPEDLPDPADEVRSRANELNPPAQLLLGPSSPIEFRLVTLLPFFRQPPTEARSAFWFRLARPIEAPLAAHQAILAYVSDIALMATALLPHRFDPAEIQGTSLDHAIWFHEPFDVGEWLLHQSSSPWSGHSRGVNLGSIYTREGRLVASSTQEGLIRLRKPVVR